MGKPLTIGVDVRALKSAQTGIKTYLEELCREFREIQNSDLHFYFLDTTLPVYTGTNKLLKLIEHVNYQVWKQISLPLKAWSKNCDILFCTDTCVPFINLNYKTIPTIHDAFCFEFPENYGKLWLWFYMNTAVPAAKRSPYIITTTSYSKTRIQHFMEISPEKLVVVYEGPKRIDKPKGKTDQLTTSLPAIPFNYILHVGAMFKRKNIASLIFAFRKIKPLYPELQLVLAGTTLTNKSDNEHSLILGAIESTGLGSDIIVTGYLSDQELEQVYKNALIYVFPSINEGFGLPILEAFKYNLPVLVSNNTCLPEVGGDAVLQFNPFDTKDISEKINMVLKDPSLRKEMITRGQERLKDFSWRSASLQIIEVFRKAAAGQ